MRVYSCGYKKIFSFAAAFKIVPDLIVWNSEDFQIKSAKEVCPGYIIFFFDFLEVLRPIKLDYQLCFMAVEINDVIANYFLTIELDGIVFQEVIPKMMLFFCDVST